MARSFAEILDSMQKEQSLRFAAKVPSWAGTEGIRIPSKLSAEQCSSESAARYKASLVQGDSLADLTSGLGVDDWAFAGTFKSVIYNEPDESIFKAAEENFRTLGITNVRFFNKDAAGMLNILDRVDVVYMDPARRNASGKKVFLLEDCSPNVLAMLPEIWKHTGTLMLKLSPMADISMLADRLANLREIHCVGFGGECKELVCIVQKGWTEPYRIVVTELSDLRTQSIAFDPDYAGVPEIADSVSEGDILLEPSPALAKSGCRSGICRMFGLKQLDRSTHLFTALRECEPSPFFKQYRIIDSREFGNASFKQTGRLYPKSDVTARNVPMASDELRKRMGITGSGDTHIFGTSVNGERRLLVCKKMPGPEKMV